MFKIVRRATPRGSHASRVAPGVTPQSSHRSWRHQLIDSEDCADGGYQCLLSVSYEQPRRERSRLAIHAIGSNTPWENHRNSPGGRSQGLGASDFGTDSRRDRARATSFSASEARPVLLSTAA